jgi:peptidoglycan/xylan/chitin deacetylase (PgdA/CDA1 family)
MKSVLSMLLALLILLMCLFAMAEPAVEFTALVEGGTLHLRAAPRPDAPSLGRYHSGTRLLVLADGEVFCRVKAPDSKEGYMMKEYLRFENGLPPIQPSDSEPIAARDLVRKNALERGIDPSKPMLALTFDDGPQRQSLRVLQALNQNGARATFFILGKNIAGNEDIIRQIAKGGHELAVHSWSHPNFTRISESAVRSQVTRTMDKIHEITGQTPRLVRTPYGASNRVSRRPLTELGLPLILWSVDSLDWKTLNAAKTIATIKEKAANGAIILCHDIWDSTGQAMEIVLPELIGMGYQLVTVSEMMSFREELLKPGWEYGFLDVKKIEPGLTPVPPGLVVKTP